MIVCNMGKHYIKLENKEPIKQNNYRVPINFEKQIDDEVNKLIQLGIIKESNSPWCSRIVPIKKRMEIYVYA